MKQILLITAMVITTFSLALADGILIPRPRPGIPINPAVDVKYHHVDVEINDPAALTKIDQVFVNPYRREIEADYIFPIPEGAAISRFIAWLNEHKMEAELLDADQARKVYEDIVRQRKDPALLEYAGRGMYRLRVYPIPAGGEVRIKIEYEQLLKADNGTVKYLYPLNTEKYSGSNLKDCKVDVNIKSFEKIGAVYCPSHNTDSKRIGDKSYEVSYHEENVKPDKDFILYFTRQKSDFGFHLLSYREPGNNDGYFIGLLSPPLENNNRQIDKNIIFVLDSSGSMRGDKFKQAIAALKFVLLGLKDGDDFNIIDYDDAVKPYEQKLIRANEKNIADAITFAENLDAAGGTNIYEALASACSMVSHDDDPTYILFLTDGLPTSGITDINKIISNTTTLNEGRARLFVFGVGYNVNAHLLDRLAQQNQGIPEYVLPDEDIEIKVSRLAAKISKPALTDVSLSFGSTRSFNTYPEPLPDLFYGSEIIITGRFDGKEKSQAIIKGKIAGDEVIYKFPVNFDKNEDENDFIALLWANRRIGYLTQQIRLHGTSSELLTEIVSLSKKYGIVTEYTSFLITGDEHVRADSYMRMSAPQLSKKLEKEVNRLAKVQTGKSAVSQSKKINKQVLAEQLQAPGILEIDGETTRYVNITQVGSKGFFQSDKNWIQGDIEDDSYDMEIKRFSRAYFQLLENDPSLGKYLSLGNQVRLKIGSQIVQVSDSGKEILNDEELKLLFKGL